MRTDLLARIDALVDDYRAIRMCLDGLQATAAAMTVTVRSPDRSVTVTVNAQGELCDIRIDPAVAGRVDWTALSARILGAARLAIAQAKEHKRVTMRAGLPERIRDLVAADGSVDLASILPAELGRIGRGSAAVTPHPLSGGSRGRPP
jgi:DNA-binding protein YbaB